MDLSTFSSSYLTLPNFKSHQLMGKLHRNYFVANTRSLMLQGATAVESYYLYMCPLRHIIFLIRALLFQCDTKELQENIGRAEDDVLKQCEAKTGLVLSPAFAISQFVTSLAKAIKGDKNSVVCCYVRQTGHIGDFLKYMTSIVKLGNCSFKDVIPTSKMHSQVDMVWIQRTCHKSARKNA